MKTIGKVKIPVGAQKEAELKFIRQIVNNVEKHQILSSLTINFDFAKMRASIVNSHGSKWRN